jgi:hypothetical protein
MMNALNRSYTSASGEERSRERAVQVSEASTSISAVSSMPLALYSSVNADILLLMLSSGHITPRDAALPAAEPMDSALRAEMMEIYGSQRNELAVNATSQLSGNNSTPTQLRTTAQLLYAEALCIEARMRTGLYPLQAARAIPSVEQQLRLLIQEQQAQQTLAVAASNIAASRNASYSLADPRMSQSLTLECLQLLTQQHHQKQQQQTLLDTLIQAQIVPQAGLQAGNYSFGNRARDQPTPQPSSTIWQVREGGVVSREAVPSFGRG